MLVAPTDGYYKSDAHLYYALALTFILFLAAGWYKGRTHKAVCEPDEWHACTKNSWRVCTEGINCYSYALNRPDYYWSVPGFGFTKTEGQKYIDAFDSLFGNYSLGDFQKALQEGAARDGLIPVIEATNREGYYLTALFFAAEHHDFHWYRKDDNGFWSHKNGWNKVSDRDEAGKRITDPREAINASYPVFGGFFLMPKNGVVLSDTFPPSAVDRVVK